MNARSLVAALLITSGALAQEPVGTWHGGFRLSGQYDPVMFRISREGGSLVGELEIPSRDILGAPLVVELDAPGLRLTMDHPAKGRARFHGLLEDGLFTGEIIHEIGGVTRRGRFETAKIVEMDREQLRRFEGAYEIDGFGPLKLFVLAQPTRLSLQAFALRFGSQIPLFPVAESEFLGGLTVGGGPPVMARLRFEMDEDGGVDRLQFQRPGTAPVAGRPVDDRLALGTERIRSRIERMREAGNVPSYSVGVVQRDDLVFAESFGFADLESREPATPQTLYQVGSLSKGFAATLFGMLAEEGIVALDDPVRIHLPEDRSFPVLEGRAGSRITLARLLTHTSGLPRDPGNRPDIEGVPAPYGVDDLYAELERTRLLFLPGEHWAYSNLGFGLLGHVLARSAGQTFEELLRERLLEPLGMGDTSVSLTPERRARLATHYWIEDADRRGRPHWVFGEIAANGGVVSSVVDLAKLMSLQMKAGRDGVTPVSGSTLSWLHEPRRRRGGWNETIGLGWWVDHSEETGTVVSHGGEIDGHSTHFAFSPRYQVGVIVLANLGGSTAFDLGSWLMEEVVFRAREQWLPSDTEASTWYARGEWADAAEAYGKMAAANPGNGMAQYRHGRALYETHRDPEALGAFERALELGYAPANTRYYLALLHANRGDTDRAFEELEAAVDAGLTLDTVERAGPLRALSRDPRFAALTRRR